MICEQELAAKPNLSKQYFVNKTSDEATYILIGSGLQRGELILRSAG